MPTHFSSALFESSDAKEANEAMTALGRLGTPQVGFRALGRMRSRVFVYFVNHLYSYVRTYVHSMALGRLGTPH